MNIPDSIAEIAYIISKDWSKQGKGVSPCAEPYLSAMYSLSKKEIESNVKG